MPDFHAYLQFVFALVFVLSLIGGCAWLLKRFLLGRGMRGPKAGKRLEVLESQMIDARRRLVLLRRDNVEHLLLLGPNHETLVESGIHRADEARARGPEARAATAGPNVHHIAAHLASETEASDKG